MRLHLIFQVSCYFIGEADTLRAEKMKTLLFDMRNSIIVSWNSYSLLCLVHFDIYYCLCYGILCCKKIQTKGFK